MVSKSMLAVGIQGSVIFVAASAESTYVVMYSSVCHGLAQLHVCDYTHALNSLHLDAILCRPIITLMPRPILLSPGHCMLLVFLARGSPGYVYVGK